MKNIDADGVLTQFNEKVCIIIKLLLKYNHYFFCQIIRKKLSVLCLLDINLKDSCYYKFFL